MGPVVDQIQRGRLLGNPHGIHFRWPFPEARVDLASSHLSKWQESSKTNLANSKIYSSSLWRADHSEDVLWGHPLQIWEGERGKTKLKTEKKKYWSLLYPWKHEGYSDKEEQRSEHTFVQVNSDKECHVWLS